MYACMHCTDVWMNACMHACMYLCICKTLYIFVYHIDDIYTYIIHTYTHYVDILVIYVLAAVSIDMSCI